MGLLRKLIAEKTVRVPLEFGINENIIISKLDNEVRMYEGNPLSKYCFISFSKVNEKNEIIANQEISYYKLDHEREVEKNINALTSHLAQLNNIASTVCPGSEVNPFPADMSEEDLLKSLATKAGCDKLANDIFSCFNKIVEPFVGVEKCPKMRLKLILDGKGKYLQLPYQSNIVESMDDALSLYMTASELKAKEKSNTPVSATGDVKPDAAPPKKSVLGSLI